MSFPPDLASHLIIISGPAGSGKTTLCDRLLQSSFPITRLITSTSRDPREGEINGIDYHFLKPNQFKEAIERGEFIEWAFVHGRYYCAQKKHLLDALHSGKDVLLNIDVQGAENYRSELGKDPRFHNRLISIFVRPPSMDEIRSRLTVRGTDDNVEIDRRIESAKKELQAAPHFDFIIESRSKEEDFLRLVQIYQTINK